MTSAHRRVSDNGSSDSAVCTNVDFVHILIFYIATLTDRFVETGWPNGSYRALNPNSCSWSSRVSRCFNVPSLNLTFEVHSNVRRNILR
jgi:hypothetical protein